MSISEQVKELRKAAKWFESACFPDGVKLVTEAADTIESLSAKLEKANKELERWHTDKINDKIKNPFAWTSTLCCHNCDHKDEYIEELEASDIERSAEDCGGGWIYCGDGKNLPKEPFACIVTVIDTEPMTMTDFEAILPYQVGYSSGTWNDSDGRQIPFDVIAWMKAPTEPYHEP